MAGITDFLYLAVTILILGGSVAGILFVVNKISEFTSNTKEKMKSKGYDVSKGGMTVQTKKRFDREDYVDATQRGLIKTLNASSFGKANVDGSGSAAHKVTQSTEENAKKPSRGVFKRKS